MKGPQGEVKESENEKKEGERRHLKNHKQNENVEFAGGGFQKSESKEIKTRREKEGEKREDGEKRGRDKEKKRRREREI
uniref:Uncharacterized protein n=1 Tax=Octopus bimaculoides TaxID=37653 RepID=A0A0L8G2X0_OCTBM